MSISLVCSYLVWILIYVVGHVLDVLYLFFMFLSFLCFYSFLTKLFMFLLFFACLTCFKFWFWFFSGFLFSLRLKQRFQVNLTRSNSVIWVRPCLVFNFFYKGIFGLRVCLANNMPLDLFWQFYLKKK